MSYPIIDVSSLLISLINNYLEVVLVLKTPETFAKSLGNYPLRRVIAATFQVQLYLNHSLQCVPNTRNLEMIFSKNNSDAT